MAVETQYSMRTKLLVHRSMSSKRCLAPRARCLVGITSGVSSCIINELIVGCHMTGFHLHTPRLGFWKNYAILTCWQTVHKCPQYVTRRAPYATDQATIAFRASPTHSSCLLTIAIYEIAYIHNSVFHLLTDIFPIFLLLCNRHRSTPLKPGERILAMPWVLS